MTAVAAGQVRSEKTYQKIVDALDYWDLLQGKITNEKLAVYADVHINTLKRYIKKYPELKSKKGEINNTIKRMNEVN